MMKGRYFQILFILAFIFSCTAKLSPPQYNRLVIEKQRNFKLTSIVENDTISLSEGQPLIGRVLNKTSRAMFFSDEIDIFSNLFPNGDSSAQIFKTSSFYFQISPVPRYAGIDIENLEVTYPKSFVKINAKSVYNYTLNIAAQIKEYNNHGHGEGTPIATNRWYTLDLIFAQHGNWNKVDTFIGYIKAKPIKFYLKP